MYLLTEPINPEAWQWYFRVVGKERCAVIDTYWQTETGSFLIAPYACATPTKAGSATLPQFGIVPAILDATTGKVMEGMACAIEDLTCTCTRESDINSTTSRKQCDRRFMCQTTMAVDGAYDLWKPSALHGYLSHTLSWALFHW